MRGITAEEVADYRKQHGCGMMEARRAVEKRHVDEHIGQLESALDEVAEKWAIAQVNYEDCARRNTLLEALVRDLYECNCACTCDECVRRNEEEWDGCEIINTRGTFRERMAALGLLDGDAE